MSEQQHILILSSWFPTAEKPFLGNFVEIQAHLIAKEYKVSFVRLFSDKQQKTGINNRLNIQFVDGRYRKSKNPVKTYFSKKKALKEALARVGTVDIIHVHVSYPDGWLFRLVKKQLDKPLVLTEHGSYFEEGRTWDFRMKNAVVNAVKSADVIVAVSSFLARDIKKRFPSVNPVVIGNPIDLTAFRVVEKSMETIHFLHISTLDKIKNIEPVLQAFSKVLKTVPNLKLTIVSDEDYSVYKQLAADLEISEKVVFDGPVSHEQIFRFYREAHCLIMNSRYESFSIVVAEAWASGIPVISTPVGIASGMTPELGILTDGTQTGVEEAMHEYIRKQKTYNPEEIRRYAGCYSAENILEKLKVIYERLPD